ncbi:tyrosine-type recombinase/integrase [Legionella pneumophila]|uniref:Phage-related integrase n=1 Tax=Legionella pneumophila subsp. pascullei TaxID=91890 RepID=A0AAX2IZV2_LEGPN|nr:site-specific integrase [Legionella pneumophila]AMP93465.1 integrase [Legionella pneumophila subsp. pascullei]SQG91410.1 phage-related integrase [Legionella pneumophila subsp. pascullei]VEH07956.1 phage-related integrase [Legionella pneumophila subsp. pascullei]HAU3861588.1 tyrosine-type recombinase/integrase [Legionella pneumophila]HBD7059949.1 tyrosine-type recombinase/integrase [Legionella pneumophila]
MVRFTDTYIKNLKPSDKRVELFEGDGFGIFVYPTGTKTWVYRYKIDGKKDHVTIGNYPTVSLSEAKRQFMDLRAIKKAGNNPKQTIVAPQEESYTVKDLVTNWYENYIKRHRKCPGQIEQIIKADIIPMLGSIEVEELKTKDITRSLDTIVNRGSPVHANKVLSALKQAFNYAVSRGELSVNHAANIRSRDIGGIEKPRERFLTLEEIKQLWQFLSNGKHSVSLQITNAIKILLLTGVRTGELRVAKWNEIDFENSLWTIPAINTKTGITMRVHLTSMVKSLFMELYNCSMGEYVISSADGQSPLSDRALPKAVIRLQERIGIDKWTPHDLRRTFATQLGESLNIDPVVIEKCLGHKMPKIMATYNKNEMLPQRRDALEKWSGCIMDLVYENIDL